MIANMVALAVPLTAALKVMVEELYIKDALGGGVEPSRVETDAG